MQKYSSSVHLRIRIADIDIYACMDQQLERGHHPSDAGSMNEGVHVGRRSDGDGGPPDGRRRMTRMRLDDEGRSTD